MHDARSKFKSPFRSLALGFAMTFVLSAGLNAHADDAKKAAPPKGNGKRTTINFEDQLVEGQTQKPELFYLLQQRNNNFKRLIRLRENFLPEMRKTSEDISRSTGKGTDE